MPFILLLQQSFSTQIFVCTPNHVHYPQRFSRNFFVLGLFFTWSLSNSLFIQIIFKRSICPSCIFFTIVLVQFCQRDFYFYFLLSYHSLPITSCSLLITNPLPSIFTYSTFISTPVSHLYLLLVPGKLV